MLALNLAFAALLGLVTFAIHFVGLVALSAAMRRRQVHPSDLTTLLGQGSSILTIVFALFLLHSIEIWLYALAYLAVGAFDALEPALYFSTSAFTTVGIGDVYLGEDWRMLSAAEAMNGFLLIGWSTAFLVSVSAKVRAFEADIARRDEEDMTG